MTISHIFFDFNSTIPMLPEVKKEMIQAMDIVGNSSSVHYFGRQARNYLEQSRQTIAQYLKASPEEIIFNSGSTEGNNTILQTFLTINANIITSSIEHKSVLDCIKNYDKNTTHIISIDHNGLISIGYVKKLLQEMDHNKKTLISIMLANNEIGTIQPLNEIITLARQYKNVYIHSDIAQALGKIPVNLEQYPVDYLTLSSHKIGGPTGIGAIYVRPRIPYKCLILGGGQEKDRRSGTSNVLGAMGFAKAIKCIDTDKWHKCKYHITHIENEIMNFCQDAEIFAIKAPRLPNTVSIYMPNINNMLQLAAFDLENFAIGAGSACSSGTIHDSHVLNAAGIANEKISQTIRVSISPSINLFEINKFINAWKKIYNRAISS